MKNVFVIKNISHINEDISQDLKVRNFAIKVKKGRAAKLSKCADPS
jgi:hypothetical protein